MSSTLRLSNRTEAAGDSEPTDGAEQRMRRALGLLPAGEKSARQPAPTAAAMRNARSPGQGVNRVAIAEAAVATERQARERAEKLLSDAEATVLKLTTKLGQVELARDQSVAALAVERQRREQAEAQVEQLSARPTEPVSAAPTAASAPKKRGRKPAMPTEAAPEPASEDQPVEWWVPGWRSR